MSHHKQTLEDSRSRSHLKLVGALLLLSLAVGGLYFFVFRSGSKPDLKQFGTLGEYAAEEVAKIIGRSGRVVLVYDIYDPKAGGSDAGAAFADQGMQAAGFRKRMAGLGSYSFAQDFKLARPNMVFRSVWPAGTISKLVNANPPETTIVLFATPPQRSKEEKNMLQSRSGKLVVVGGALPDVQWLAKERLAHLIIASRYPVPPPPKNPESDRQMTQRVYAVVTPETVTQP